MPEAWRLPLQALAYIALAALLGYFATEPEYRYADPDMASIKVALSHAAERVEPCVELTPEQIAEFAANMRRTQSCERARLPLVFELDVDGRTFISVTAEPSGLWNDGPASVYRRRAVEPGRYRLTVRLRDSARSEGWDYTASETVDLVAGRYLTVTFHPTTGGFVFR